MAEIGVRRSDGGGATGSQSLSHDEIVLRVLDQIQLNMLKFQSQFNELSVKIEQLEETQKTLIKSSTSTDPPPNSTSTSTSSTPAELEIKSEDADPEPSAAVPASESEAQKSEESPAVSLQEIMRLDGRIDVIVKELSIIKKDLRHEERLASGGMIDDFVDKSLLLETSWKGGLNSTSMMVQAEDDLDDEDEVDDEDTMNDSTADVNQQRQSTSMVDPDKSNYAGELGDDEDDDEQGESMTIQPEIYLDEYDDDEGSSNTTNNMNQMGMDNGGNGMDMDQDDDDDDEDDIQYEEGSEDELAQKAYFSMKGQGDHAIEYKIIKATGKHQCPLFPVCQVECLSRTNLMRHYYNTHASTVTFQCPVCGIGYARKDNLSKHYKKKHEKIYGPLYNPAAQARPRMEYEQQQHRRMPVQAQRRLGGGASTDRAVTTGIMKRPGPVPRGMVSGGQPRPHRCHLCGITYNWRKNLNQHMKAKHGILMPPGTRGPQAAAPAPLVKPQTPAKATNYVTCRLCPTSFRTTEELARHYTARHRPEGRPPTKASTTPKSKTSLVKISGHECPVCHKLFSKREILKRHMSMHRKTSTPIATTTTVAQTSAPDSSTAEAIEEGVAGVLGPNGVHEKQCRICLKEFTRREHVKRHLKLHSGQERYACVGCNKVYSRKDQLRQHQRQAHGKVLQDLEPMDNGDEYQD